MPGIKAPRHLVREKFSLRKGRRVSRRQARRPAERGNRLEKRKSRHVIGVDELIFINARRRLRSGRGREIERIGHGQRDVGQ